MANDKETPPGCIFQSSKFVVEFMGQMSNNIQEQDNEWMDVMIMIFEALHAFPTSMKDVGHDLEKSLFDWLHIPVAVEMPSKYAMHLTIGFADSYNTTLYYYITSRMNTLKNIASIAVVEQLKEENDIMQLEIPKTLIPNLLKVFKGDLPK